MIIWAMVAGYVLLYLWLGLVFRKYNRNFPAFATARSLIRPWMVGFSAAATLASANLYVGVPGWAYKYGYSVLWWIIGNTITMSIGLVLFARRFFLFYREQNFSIYTMPHWLGIFFKSRVLRFGVAVLTLFNVYYIAGQNIGLATIFEEFSHVPYAYGVILGVVVVVTYSICGGQGVGIVTDAIQLVLMAATGLLILGSLFWVFGYNAHRTIHATLLAQDPSLVSILAKDGVFSDWISIISIQWLLLTFILLPHLGNIVLALDNEKEIKPFLISACGGFFFASSFMWLGGLAARVLYPSLANPDSAILVYILKNFSTIPAGIVIGGIVAAVMSTTDSLYVGMATIATNDILPVKERKVLASRVVMALIAVVSIFLSLQRPKSLTLLTQFGISAIISGIAVLIGYAHFGKRKIPSWAALLIFFAGSGTYLALTISGLFENVFKALGVASLTSLLILVIVLLFLFVKTERRTQDYCCCKK